LGAQHSHVYPVKWAGHHKGARYELQTHTAMVALKHSQPCCLRCWPGHNCTQSFRHSLRNTTLPFEQPLADFTAVPCNLPVVFPVASANVPPQALLSHHHHHLPLLPPLLLLRNRPLLLLRAGSCSMPTQDRLLLLLPSTQLPAAPQDSLRALWLSCSNLQHTTDAAAASRSAGTAAWDPQQQKLQQACVSQSTCCCCCCW